MAILKNKFEERSYPSSLVVEQFDRAKQEERRNLVIGERKYKRKNNGKVNFILTQNQTNPPLHKWLRDSKKQLEREDAAKAIGDRLQISYKLPRNLQNIVGGCNSQVKGGSKPPPDAGCSKCGECRVLCPKINETKYFISKATTKRYPIRQQITCTIDWVIYFGTCLKCKGYCENKALKP